MHVRIFAGVALVQDCASGRFTNADGAGLSGQGGSHIGPFMNNTCIGAFGGISDGEITTTPPAGSVSFGYNHFYTPSGNISVNGNMTLDEAQSMGFEIGSTVATMASLEIDEVLQMIRKLLSFE